MIINDNNESKLKFSKDESVLLVNLKSNEYNNKECIVQEFNKDTNRYVVFIKSLNKQISVKEENLIENKDLVIEID